MRTGEVAAETGVDRETLRFYEQKGLIKKPKRNSSGYRVYEPSILEDIEFIKNAKASGFSLGEISTLLEFKFSGVKCKQGRDFAHEKLTEINAKINSLNDMKKVLTRFLRKCDSEGKSGLNKKCHLSFEVGERN